MERRGGVGWVECASGFLGAYGGAGRLGGVGCELKVGLDDWPSVKI